MSIRPCLEKLSVTPAPCLDCTTKDTLRTSRNGWIVPGEDRGKVRLGVPQRPAREAAWLARGARPLRGRASRVSGSSRAKTYGKDLAMSLTGVISRVSALC